MNSIEVKSMGDLRGPLPPVEQFEVTLQMTRDRLNKLQAFMDGDMWDAAQAAREAKLSECTKSVAVLLNTARRHMGTSGGRVCATLLASLYNGERVKFDVSDLRRLDMALFEHALNTMRACYELSMEPHQFFENGSQLIEQMIADWGLEKKKRRRG